MELFKKMYCISKWLLMPQIIAFANIYADRLCTRLEKRLNIQQIFCSHHVLRA